LGVYGFLFGLIGNAAAAIGVSAPKRSDDDELNMFVLSLGTESFSVDNCLAAHRSHSSHRSHTSHTSAMTPQSHASHSSHYSATAPVQQVPRTTPPLEVPVERIEPASRQEPPSATENRQGTLISVQTLEQEYTNLHVAQQRVLAAATSRTGSLFLSPLMGLRAQVRAVAPGETVFLSELGTAIAAVIERETFHATTPVQGVQLFSEKEKFCGIKKDWDGYLGKARQVVFERNKSAYTDLLDRALQVGNTNLVERISKTLIPSETPKRAVAE